MSWRSVGCKHFSMSESRTLTNKCLTGIQISLAELQSLLSELEGRNEGQAANIESLTATLKTKDEIIDVRIHPIQKNLVAQWEQSAAWNKQFFFSVHMISSSAFLVLMFCLCLWAGSPPAPRSERGQSGGAYRESGHWLWHGEITPWPPSERDNHDWWRQPARSKLFFWMKPKTTYFTRTALILRP